MSDTDRLRIKSGRPIGRMLVVEDTAVNANWLTRALAREGHRVTIAENGREALERLHAESFDAVLLDIVMPEMDGYETLQRIKSDPALRHIPVIMISAIDQMDSVVRCIEIGATDYLPRPVSEPLLTARIGACLAEKRLRDLELVYLEQVSHLTAAASALEAGTYDGSSLDGVAARDDALGQLARVFKQMAQEVVLREQRLQQELHAMRIQIDESRRDREVRQITETEYFRALQARIKELRGRPGKDESGAD